MSDNSPVRRPYLAVRVGVTGKRNVPNADAVGAALGQVLALIKSQCQATAASPPAREVYAAPGGEVVLRLAMISPIAEGADRLAAREALSQGYSLFVPMPFERSVYESTFEHGLQDFSELLARAEGALELDGVRGRDEWRAYDAVGRLIVRNCDLLLAVWDPEAESAGRGGTEDVVGFAVKIGVPVWLIDPSGTRPPALIARPAEMRHPHAGDPKARLATIITQRLRISGIAHTSSHNGLRRIFAPVRTWMATNGLLRPDQVNPLRDFLESSTPPATWVWSGYERFLKVIAWTPRPSNTYVSATIEKDWWTPLYEVSDALALSYARCYRASFLYVLALAALAPILAAAETALEAAHRPVWAWAVTAGELLILLAMLTLVVCNLVGRWHEKWISYRLLAELCRKQQALAKLGWSLSTANVTRAINPRASQASWLDWLFQAHLRAAPLAQGSFNGDGWAAARDAIDATLLKGQIAYHERRKEISATAAARLSLGGTVCFVIVLVLVAAKVLAPTLHLHVGWAASVLAVIAAISAAFFAIRAYAEFELLADQSERMVGLLQTLQVRLAEPDLDDPLASQALGADLFHLTQAMLQDVSGWAQLFRMKAVETG